MNILKADGISLIEEEIKLSRQMRASFVKVRNYIYKHCKSDRYGGALEWSDCNRMMDTLGYPKESVLRFPKSLRKLHDRLVNETNAAEERIRKAQDVPNDLKIKAQEEELSKLIYSNLLYEIVLPKDMQDIRDEGKVLDHCVASYAERHARGATHIFLFVSAGTLRNGGTPSRYRRKDIYGSVTDTRITERSRSQTASSSLKKSIGCSWIMYSIG